MNQDYPLPNHLLESWIRNRGLDLLDNCVVFLDKDLRITYTNLPFLNTFKLKPGNLVGHDFFAIDGGNWDLPPMRKLLEQTLRESSHCQNFEISHRFPKIGHIPMVINAYRWRISEEDHATVLVIQSLSSDRIETKGMHEALIRSLTDMGEGLLVIQNRRVSFVNHTLCTMLGFSCDEVLHLPTFLELFHPDERNPIAERHNARLAGETFTTCYETALAHKNGGRIEVDISVAALLLEDRPGVVVTVRDITTRKQFELALRESEERHRNFIEKLSDGVCVTLDHHIIFANPSLAKMTGYALTELNGMPLTRLAHEEDCARLLSSLQAASADDDPGKDQDFHFIRRNGETLYIRINHALVDCSGKTGVLSTLSDITDRKRMESELIESRNRLHNLISASPVPLFLKRTSDNTILFINQHAADLFGLEFETAIGKMAPEIVFPGDEAELGDETLNRYGVLHNFEVTFKNSSGLTVWAIVSEQSMIYGGEKTVLVAMHDITARKHTENRLEYLATYDSLTDLPNRKLLFERLNQAILYGERYGDLCAILYLDLDGFKCINDTYGHAAGDRALLEVSKRLKSCVRSSDTVARIGGDEFVVLLARIEEPKQAALVAKKVISRIKKPIEVTGDTMLLGVSIGVSVYGEHGKDADTLVNNADSAMYAVKSRGKDDYAFYT